MWISKAEVKRIDAMVRELQFKISYMEAIIDTFCKPSKTEGRLRFFSSEYISGDVCRDKANDFTYLSHSDAIRMLAKHIGMEFTVKRGTPTQVVLKKPKKGE